MPPSPKDTAAHNLEMFSFTFIYAIINYNIFKLTRHRRMETYEVRKNCIEKEYKYSAITINNIN